MKKVLALLLSAMMVASMAACSSGGDSGGNNGGEAQNSEASSSVVEEKRDYNVLIVNDDMACRIPLTWTEEAVKGDEVARYTLPGGATFTATYYEKDGVKTVKDLKDFYLDEYQAANGTAEIVEEKAAQINAQMSWNLRMKLTPADGSAAKEIFQYVVVRDKGYIVYDFTMEGEMDKDTNDAVEQISVRMRIATANDKKEAEEKLTA